MLNLICVPFSYLAKEIVSLLYLSFLSSSFYLYLLNASFIQFLRIVFSVYFSFAFPYSYNLVYSLSSVFPFIIFGPFYHNSSLHILSHHLLFVPIPFFLHSLYYFTFLCHFFSISYLFYFFSSFPFFFHPPPHNFLHPFSTSYLFIFFPPFSPIFNTNPPSLLPTIFPSIFIRTFPCKIELHLTQSLINNNCKTSFSASPPYFLRLFTFLQPPTSFWALYYHSFLHMHFFL